MEFRDLGGLGEVVRHIKEFCLALINLIESAPRREAELVAQHDFIEQAREHNRIENERQEQAIRHGEELHRIDLRSREEDVSRKQEENRSLALSNHEREVQLAVELVRFSRENDVAAEQIVQVVQMISTSELSVASFIRARIELEPNGGSAKHLVTDTSIRATQRRPRLSASVRQKRSSGKRGPKKC